MRRQHLYDDAAEGGVLPLPRPRLPEGEPPPLRRRPPPPPLESERRCGRRGGWTLDPRVQKPGVKLAGTERLAWGYSGVVGAGAGDQGGVVVVEPLLVEPGQERVDVRGSAVHH